MLKYTKGPWDISPSDEISGYYFLNQAWEEQRDAVEGPEWEEVMERDRGNARLMKAAPEMFEGLLEIKGLLKLLSNPAVREVTLDPEGNRPAFKKLMEVLEQLLSDKEKK